MGTVTFEEVKDMFDIGTVWTSGREEYWFQFAWSLLEKAQMTRYCNVYEEKTIHLYAVVLVAVYLEFCEITWEEYCEERILLDIEESFSPLEIGQLLKQFLKPGEIITDMEEAINEIVFHLKYRLFHAMVRYVSASEIFAGMFCTSYTPCEINEEDEYIITSSDEYKTMIQKCMDTIMCEATCERLPSEGFDYVCSLI